MAAPRSVHFAAVHRILRYIRGTFSRAVLFSVIVFFRVACNYWCRLGLQIGAQLQASLFCGETLHYLGWDKSNRQLLLPLPKRSTCHGTLLDRLYGSVGDFLIAGFICPTPFILRQIRSFMQEFHFWPLLRSSKTSWWHHHLITLFFSFDFGYDQCPT